MILFVSFSSYVRSCSSTNVKSHFCLLACSIKLQKKASGDTFSVLRSTDGKTSLFRKKPPRSKMLQNSFFSKILFGLIENRHAKWATSPWTIPFWSTEHFFLIFFKFLTPEEDEGGKKKNLTPILYKVSQFRLGYV